MINAENQLLFWLSEKGTATSQQLRAAWKCRSLAAQDGRKRQPVLSRISRAGHIEIDASGNVSICPPTLVLVSESCAFASGARSPALRRHLEERLPESQFSSHRDECEVWRIAGTMESIKATASELDLVFVMERGLDLLNQLPDYERLLSGISPLKGVCTRNWLHCRWNMRLGQLQWLRGDADSGVFKKKFGHRWTYLLRRKDGTCRELKSPAERAAGIWLSLPDLGARACYDTTTNVLKICPGILPPVLIDRALRMASGFPPTKKHDELHYVGVDHERAHECSRLLCCPLTLE